MRVGIAGHPAISTRGALLDRALRDAVNSGLPLRIRLRVELWKDETFDDLRAAEQFFWILAEDPLRGRYELSDGQATRIYSSLAAADAGLDAALQLGMRPRGRGRFYYLAALEVETFSLSDLEELRRWLRGEVRPAVQGRGSGERALEEGARRLLVRVLGLPTRRWEARSRTFRPG